MLKVKHINNWKNENVFDLPFIEAETISANLGTKKLKTDLTYEHNHDFDHCIRQVQRNQLTSISPEIIRKS